jgi:Zn-dependent protease
MFWIALAGPASNFFLAIIGVVLMNMRFLFPLGPDQSALYFQVLQMFVYLNLFLCFFNLIPVHPLDGGKILARFLPVRANIWLEQNSGTISMLLFAAIIFDALSPGPSFIAAPVKLLYSLLAHSVGYLFAFLY